MEDKQNKIEITDREYQRLIISKIKEELTKKLEDVDSLDIFKSILQNTIREVEQIPIKEIETLNEIEFKEITTFNVENAVLSELNKYYIFRAGLMTIGGKTHSGKTSLLLNITLDILMNNPEKNVCYIALDDSFTFIAKKIVSMIKGKDMRNITKNDWEEVVKEKKDVFKRFFITNRFDLDKLHKYDIIVLDYFQNIETPFNADIRNYLNKVLSEIKEFTKTGNKLFIIVSQINRERKKEKTEFYYRETSELENVSDVCLDIENVYQDKEKTQYKGNLLILKKNKEYPTYMEFEVCFKNGILSRGFLEEEFKDKIKKKKVYDEED